MNQERMRVCSPVVRKFPGENRELQIQVLTLSDLKLISIKYSLEESKMSHIPQGSGNRSKSEQGLKPGDALPMEAS